MTRQNIPHYDIHDEVRHAGACESAASRAYAIVALKKKRSAGARVVGTQDGDLDVELEQTGDPNAGGLDFVFEGDDDDDADAPPALDGGDFALSGGGMLGDDLPAGDGADGSHDDDDDEEEEEEEEDGDDTDAL